MEFKQVRKGAIGVASFVILLQTMACAVGTVEVDALSFEPAPMERASYMPTKEEVQRGKPRVAILPLELQRDQSAFSASVAKKLEPAMRAELEKALLASNKVEVLDRNMAKRLQGALAEYEKRKGDTPKPFQQADYLLIGQIDVMSTGSEYKEPTVNSKGRELPGICITQGNISGVLKIYDLLENTTKDITDIKGRNRNVVEAPGCAKLTDNNTMKLLQLATQDGIKDSSGFLRKFFAPRGYIAEKRTDGKNWVFKVSTLGSAMSEYKSVKIFERRQAVNALTGNLDIEVVSVGEGRVTDQSGSDFIWILVSDEKIANRIKLGHLVRPDSVALNLKQFIPSLN